MPPCYIFTDISVSIILGNHRAKKLPIPVLEMSFYESSYTPLYSRDKNIVIHFVYLLEEQTIIPAVDAPVVGKGDCHSALIQTTAMLCNLSLPFSPIYPALLLLMVFIESILVTNQRDLVQEK